MCEKSCTYLASRFPSPLKTAVPARKNDAQQPAKVMNFHKLGFIRIGLLYRPAAGYFAPRPQSTTFAVSKMMARSSSSERCFI